MPSRKPSRSSSKSLSKNATTGAQPAPEAAPTPPTPSHQTHGGFTPTTGSVRNARQLLRGPTVAKGSIGSFKTLEAYSSYLRGLNDAQLSKHAIEEAHIVAIDDRNRLIKRLEGEWSGHAIHEPNSELARIPQRPPFTDEQLAKQAAIKKQLLGR